MSKIYILNLQLKLLAKPFSKRLKLKGVLGTKSPEGGTGGKAPEKLTRHWILHLNLGPLKVGVELKLVYPYHGGDALNAVNINGDVVIFQFESVKEVVRSVLPHPVMIV